METRKVLSALSYFSIMFAGFIFPLIVFFASEDREVKRHAKSAFLSHLIPLVPVPFIVFAAVTQFAVYDQEIPVFFLAAVGITIILLLIVFIWNIIKGVKVLIQE
ncbi:MULTISPECIES: DUF4870 domain-containing protein [Cytobacillus]|uniref:DUF4870 domain-containing protein n=1 Tax=Cytobacillus firmus TaxID=1399 RepID=A0AA46PMU8_CYTFI|nr:MULTISPECIES: DUF4870 domain-containing protein [Cytobacillus]KML42692.1 hypothetical protein VL14_08430 [Cytobacillus firmus]MCC3648638.1 DUF4870 domain-containing protein [Cytobacillus oceanisediminis]MCS0654662.1 DUF4870 domain-containing protein [Cytobacillus firmus]UYG93945.1 DUF4870 domain-containing protein [Cytobacillus firmus]